MTPPHHHPHLTFWDTVSLIFGIVVGVSIFSVPPRVFAGAGSTSTAVLIWIGGGVLAVCGALCYCELATAFPKFGAEYVYLSKAYGRRTGLLYAWMQMAVILTGSIGAMAFVFADYAAQLIPERRLPPGALAALAILVPGVFQFLGFHSGKTAQNVLSLAKVASLTGLLACGLFFPVNGQHSIDVSQSSPHSWVTGGLALVFVLYAYGGWSDAATVIPEVYDHRRTMPRALLFGLGGITLLYVLLNLAYVRTLGYEGVIRSDAPAADVVKATLGLHSSWIMSGMVMLSALGAINGMLFAGCRLLIAVGVDYPELRHWNTWSRGRAPLAALATILAISIALVLTVGTAPGRGLVDRVYQSIGLFAPDWASYGRGFDTLVAATAPIFWIFFALSGLSVMVLRRTRPDVERTFRVPLYPLVPLIFIASAGFMLWSSVMYARQLTVLVLPLIAAGVLATLFVGPGAEDADEDQFD